MGKAATNENLRLRATYYNSLAVGLTLAGVALPYLSIATNPPFGFLNIMIDNGTATIELGDGLTPTIGIVLALAAALLCRRRALKLAAQLQD